MGDAASPPLRAPSSSRDTSSLILSMQWDLAEGRISEHPAEARAIVAPLGETPLATACRMKANPSLIKALLGAHPDAAVSFEDGAVVASC